MAEIEANGENERTRVRETGRDTGPGTRGATGQQSLPQGEQWTKAAGSALRVYGCCRKTEGPTGMATPMRGGSAGRGGVWEGMIMMGMLRRMRACVGRLCPCGVGMGNDGATEV